MGKQIKSASIIKQEDGRFKAGVLFDDALGQSETFDSFEQATDYLATLESDEAEVEPETPADGADESPPADQA